MTKINFHTHTEGSDSKITAEQVIEESIAHKVEFLCFTDHYPAPENLNPYAKDFYKDEHLKKLQNIQEKYKGKIDISIGVEMEWFTGYKKWYKKEFRKRNYDYIICSIHALLNKGTVRGFWDKPEEIDSFIEAIGGKKKYVQEYYKQLRLMVKSKLFDCVGHFDIVKFNNQNNILFSEQEAWYVKEVMKTLRVIKESGIAIELNTRGILKRGEGQQYPSLWILKEACKLKIPLTIGTDMHNLDQTEPFLEKAYGLAKEAGYKELVRFKNRKPISFSI